MVADAVAVAAKELKLSQEAHSKAQSSAEAAGRQADKLTHKLANMPKVQTQHYFCFEFLQFIRYGSAAKPTAMLKCC